MNHDLKNSTASVFGRILVSLAVTAAGLVAGCSNKPPGCADSAVEQSVINILVEQVEKRVGRSDSPVVNYVKQSKIKLVDVTTSGYDEGARRHTCEATLTLTDPRDTMSQPLSYTVQGIEGSRGEYQVAYYDSTYRLPLTIWSRAESYLNYAAEEKSKADALAAQTKAVVPPNATEPDPKPVVNQQAPVESAVAAASVSATTATPPASSEVGRVSPSPVLQAEALPRTTAPSFNCTGKLSPTEQLICDTPTLAQADAALALSYSKAIAGVADPSVVKQQQREWRKTRDTCTDVDCVQASYARRAQELSP